MANYMLIGNSWQNIGKLQLRWCCNTWKWCDGECIKCAVTHTTYSSDTKMTKLSTTMTKLRGDTE